VNVAAVEKMRWCNVRLHTEHDNIYGTAPDPGTFGDVRWDSAYDQDSRTSTSHWVSTSLFGNGRPCKSALMRPIY
jgi:hypothetical protein